MKCVGEIESRFDPEIRPKLCFTFETKSRRQNFGDEFASHALAREEEELLINWREFVETFRVISKVHSQIEKSSLNRIEMYRNEKGASDRRAKKKMFREIAFNRIFFSSRIEQFSFGALFSYLISIHSHFCADPICRLQPNNTKSKKRLKRTRCASIYFCLSEFVARVTSHDSQFRRCRKRQMQFASFLRCRRRLLFLSLAVRCRHYVSFNWSCTRQ